MKTDIALRTFFGTLVFGLCAVIVFSFAASSAHADYDITTGDGTYDNSGFVGYSDTYDHGAQSFLTVGAGTVETVHIKASVAGTGTYTMTLEADASGHPSGTPLANISFDGAIAAGCADWVDVAFASPVSLDASTTYWIVFDRDDANSTGNYLDLCSVGADTYSDGTWKRFNTSAWSTITDDADVSFTITEGGGGGGEGTTTPTSTPSTSEEDKAMVLIVLISLWAFSFIGAFWLTRSFV